MYPQSLRPFLATGLLSALAGCATPPPSEPTEEAPLDTEDFAEKAGTLSCTARRDTGYESGRAFSIEVVTVDGKPVERETAEAYWKMQQAAARDGVYVRIVSGFRTQGEQQYLYGCYQRCDCNNCNLAAAPGYSNHQSGYAVDLNTHESGVYTWLSRNGARFGFARTVPSEDWHWEYMGGGAGGAWPCDGGAAGGGASPAVARAAASTPWAGAARAGMPARSSAAAPARSSTAPQRGAVAMRSGPATRWPAGRRPVRTAAADRPSGRRRSVAATPCRPVAPAGRPPRPSAVAPARCAIPAARGPAQRSGRATF